MPNKRLLIQNIGVSDTLHVSLIECVKQRRPDFVLLVRSADGIKNLEHLRPFLENSSYKYSELVLSDPIDPLRTFREIRFAVSDLMDASKLGGDLEIEVDFTGGYKGMSAAAAMVATYFGAKLFYAKVERDGDQVLANSKRIIDFNINEFKALEVYEDAIRLFNESRYEAAYQLADRAVSFWGGSSVYNDACMLKKLSGVYMQWDLFDYESACANLTREVIEYYSDQKLDLSITKRYLVGVVKAFDDATKRSKELFPKKTNILQIPPQYDGLPVDLWENARRRIEEEAKYDDGMARIYRLFELVSQMRLYKYGLITAALTKSSLASALKEKFSILDPNLVEDLNKKDCVQISFDKGFKILSLLNDPVAEFYKVNSPAIKNIQVKRNYSYLMHGFEPVGKEDAKEILTISKKMLKRLYVNFDEMHLQVTYPKLCPPYS